MIFRKKQRQFRQLQQKTQKKIQQTIAGIEVTIYYKSIKNSYLRICPKSGEVRLSVPLHAHQQQITRFIRDKSAWIERHQEHIQRKTPLSDYHYQAGEVLPLWGKNYPLRIETVTGKHRATLQDSEIYLFIRENTQKINREKVIRQWYRQQMDNAIIKLLAQWQPRMGKTVNSWQIRQMTSRWGTCHIHRQHIVLNASLVEKPPACLEYVLVHEMIHLFERYHNARFYALMGHYLPNWQVTQQLLNA